MLQQSKHNTNIENVKSFNEKQGQGLQLHSQCPAMLLPKQFSEFNDCQLWLLFPNVSRHENKLPSARKYVKRQCCLKESDCQFSEYYQSQNVKRIAKFMMESVTRVHKSDRSVQWALRSAISNELTTRDWVDDTRMIREKSCVKRYYRQLPIHSSVSNFNQRDSCQLSFKPSSIIILFHVFLNSDQIFIAWKSNSLTNKWFHLIE